MSDYQTLTNLKTSLLSRHWKQLESKLKFDPSPGSTKNPVALELVGFNKNFPGITIALQDDGVAVRVGVFAGDGQHVLVNYNTYFADIAVLDAYLETVEADLKLLKIQK